MRDVKAMILLALAGTAAPVPVSAQAGRPAMFSVDGLRANVDFLADDLLAGRKPGTPQFDIAALYVAQQLAAMGLKPGNGDSWYQTVRMQTVESNREQPNVVTIGGQRFDEGSQVVIANSSLPSGSIKADAVFAGWGIVSPAEGVDDYKGLDVSGKFAVILAGVPAGTPPAAAAAIIAGKARAAADRGAVGILALLPTGMANPRQVRTDLGPLLEPGTVALEPDGLPPRADRRLKTNAVLFGDAPKALFGGSGVTAAEVFAAAKRGERVVGRPLRQTVEITQTSTATVRQSANVLGIIPGSDPRLAKEYVVVTAHLDHLGTDPKAKGDDKIYNGALDNAAGVATLIETARAFMNSGRPPKRSILFAAVTEEEEGMIGSAYLAKHPGLPAGARIVANINLDMPILTYELGDIVAFGEEESTIGQVAARAAAKNGIGITPDFMPNEQIFTRSDHYSFVKQGVPSIMLNLGVRNEGQEATKKFLATNYHGVKDDANQPINWRSALTFLKVNYDITRDLADAKTAPLWYAESSYGTRFAPDQMKVKRQR